MAGPSSKEHAMSFRIGSLAQELHRKLTSQNPPEGDASSDGAASEVPSEAAPQAEAPAPAETTPAQPAEESAKPKKKMDFKSVDAYSLKLEGGFGWRNFQNGQKLDHDGGMFRLAAGLRVPVGKRLTLAPRLAYEFQGLKKPLGADMFSQAKAHMIGLELDVGIAVHPKWFSIHPTLGIGAAIYRAPGNREGTIGAEFNKNPLLFPLKESGARVEAGLQLCTWGGAVCLGAKFAGDIGINPTLEVVDGPEGGNPPMGLSPKGATVSAGVDVLRIVSNVKNRKKAENKKAEPVPAETASVSETPAEEGAVPTPAEGEPEAVPPTLPAFTLADFEENLKAIQDNHKWTGFKLDDAKKSLKAIKDSSVKRSDKKIHADSAIAFYRNSLDRTRNAEMDLAGMSNAYQDIADPEEKAKAGEILAQATALCDEMTARVLETHEVATKAVKEYNKRRGSEPEVEFDDPKPEFLFAPQE